MMRIISIKTQITTAGVACEVLNAEMELCTPQGQSVFLHINDYEGTHYTVATGSIYAFMTNQTDVAPKVKFSEEYSSWRAAQKSAYKPYFAQLRKVLKMLE